MKTKISLLIAAVALFTFSFTFVKVEKTAKSSVKEVANLSVPAPAGGLISDEVVK